ncbi:MAG: CHAT domain-containing protein [Acidobacteria bacterium]|nr:CHAT domain-containing protein [Acidobacteriota bacterium]
MPRFLHLACALSILVNTLSPVTAAPQQQPPHRGSDAGALRRPMTHEALIAALVEAPSEDARNALVAENQELLTEKLLGELNDQGRKAAFADDYALALKYFAAMQSAAKRFGDPVWMSDALNNVGIVYYLRADYDGALDYYKQALSLREVAGHKSKIAGSLFNVATIHRFQGNYAQALEWFLKSETASEAAGNKPLNAQALLNIGTVYRRTGNYALALNYYGRSLALQEEIGFKQGVADALTAIGNVHTLQSNFPQALENYRRSLAMHEASGDKRGIQAALGSIGIAYTLQGEHTQALEYLNRSLILSESMKYEQGTANTLNNIGDSLNALGERERALEHVRRALKMHEATGDRPGILVSLVGLANINLSRGDFAQALEFADRATALAREINDPWMLEQALTAAGLGHRAQGRQPQARRSFEEAIAAIEVVRGQVAGGEQDRQRFFEKKTTPYAALVELHVSENNANEAFASAERGKARVLADVLRWGRIDVTKSLTEEERARERRLKDDIVALNGRVFRASAAGQKSASPDAAQLPASKTQLAKARLDYESFQTNLYASRPALRVQRGELRPLRLEGALELLPDGQTAVLEFVLTEDKTYLFALARRGATSPALKVYVLDVGRKGLAARAGNFRNALAGRNYEFRRAAVELYELLLKPALKDLAGKKSLIIVPDAELWNLPFQALMSAPERYLVEDYAISYAPSLTVLREMATLRRKRETLSRSASAELLALGNPSFGGGETPARATESATTITTTRAGGLEPLPEAQREVEALRGLYGAGRSRIYSGAQATEEQVKAEAPLHAVLHLATHGVLDDANPLYSYVVLAQSVEAKREDGLLEAWEMMNMDLKADLVVLSACETARGRVSAGEGVVGMSWALFVAGVPTTVVSNWKVNSASTTALMLEFHRELRSGRQSANSPGRAPMTKAEALRRASLKLLKSDAYRHPFYWAAFTVVGDGGI